MNELFKCIKPNPYPMKGKGGTIGYGCFTTRKPGNKVNKRKLNRYYRKYGFDITETWNLDYTICAWLSDTVGSFFRECGSIDSWSDYDLEGNEYTIKITEDFFKADELRHEEYQKQLKNYLLNCSDSDYIKFFDFVGPRLTYLMNHTDGYPGQFNSYDEWTGTLAQMHYNLSPSIRNLDLFVEHFFSLWD